jgi:hypothetical protein
VVRAGSTICWVSGSVTRLLLLLILGSAHAVAGGVYVARRGRCHKRHKSEQIGLAAAGLRGGAIGG